MTMKATSMPIRAWSTSSGSRFHFSASRPAGPIKSPMPPSVPSTTGRSHHGYGASRAQKVVIRRRHRGRGEAQPKTVEGQMVIDPAQVARPLVLVDAADAAAVEIAQLSGVLDRLPERGRIDQHADRLADVAPERAHAHDQRHDGVEKRAAEQRRHRIVRHQLVERARAGMDAEQHLAVVQRGEAEDERRDAERRDDADRKARCARTGRKRRAARHRRHRNRRARSPASAGR